MRIAYLDCASGISGDMTLGALVDAGASLGVIQAGIDSLGLPSCKLVATTVKKKGFRATQITIEHEPEHKHRHLHHITAMIDQSKLTPRQRELATQIFTKLGEAEAKVHNSTLQKVHFHEVGAVDSIADIIGSAIGWDLLGVERIVCSPVPTGSGFVEIAHGRCSIPAPATAELLRGIPLADSTVTSELTTPTGAAIVATLASSFGPLPAMTIERIGCGAGQRDLDQQPNLLRLIVGTTEEAAGCETITILETTVDNTTGEAIGHATTRLLAAGALDVYTTAVQMKKQRPGVTITILCKPTEAAQLEAILFHETNTLGVRRWNAERRVLAREMRTVTTPLGEIRGKIAHLPGKRTRFSPEYDDCHALALEHKLPLADVMEAARHAFERASDEGEIVT